MGRPFSKPLKPSDKLPPAFLPYLNDVDRAGHSLQVWARDVFASGVSDGLVHWIVEYPDTSNVQNLAEEAGMRPYFVQISAAQVLGFRYHVNDKGEPFLDSLRILEVATKAVDEYTDEEVPQIRVMTPGAWSLWQKPNPASQQWERVKSGRTSLNFIPFVTFAPGSVGFMEAVPPLIDYAWENIGHWQSSSDQRNILHIARVPLYFGAGC